VIPHALSGAPLASVGLFETVGPPAILGIAVVVLDVGLSQALLARRYAARLAAVEAARLAAAAVVEDPPTPAAWTGEEDMARSMLAMRHSSVSRRNARRRD
jgi:hypothetical protein